MRMLLFIGVFLLILVAAYAYAGWRLLGGTGLRRGVARIVWMALALLLLLPVGVFVLQVVGEWGPSSTVLVWPAYVALGFVSFVVTLLLVRDGVWALGRLLRALRGRMRNAEVPVSPERRLLLIRGSSLGVVGAAAALTGYGIIRARRTPPVVVVEVPFRGLHPDLEGFTIMQITDVHAGLTVGRSFVEAIVEQANTRAVDLLVMTGDMVDGSVPALRDDVEPMGRLSARYGRYFVTGNHEYYSGVEPWIAEMRRIGFSVLLNEHVVLERGGARVVLAGVTDPTGGQFLPEHASSVARAVDGAPDADLRLLLAHQPKSIFEAATLNIDLQLSGHTHGGQFVPWNFFAAMAQPYISGLHRHEHTWIYVSRGAGYWGPPVRVGAASELSLIRLVPERATGRGGGKA